MSLARSSRDLLRKIGIDVHPWPSDRHLVVDYPVSTKPRYGYKVPEHSGMLALLESKKDSMAEIISHISSLDSIMKSIPNDESIEALAPFWNNGWFPPLDACVLMHFIVSRRPRHYFEIGSGNSTIFAHHAKSTHNVPMNMVSLDPEPRAGIDSLCNKVHRTGLQDVDLCLFDDLDAGDILFFDGSHVTFQDSDVAVFFLELLPRLRPGVLVQVHDIFWPKDYPPAWGKRYYSEQYLLALALLYGKDKFDTVFSSAYASDVFANRLRQTMPGRPILGTYYGMSFWFEVRG